LKILNFEYPHDLKSKLDLEITRNPVDLERIIEDCQTALNYAVKTGKYNST
jgi:hypothetical protein